MSNSPDNPETLAEEAFFSIVNGEILIWDAFQDALQTAGVPVGVGRFIPLYHLADGPLRLQELAKRTHTKESATSRLVERMVKDGLIEKGRDGRDGRAVLLRITERGRRVERQGRTVFAGCLTRLFADLSEGEAQTLCTLIARIGARNGKAGA